LSCYAPGPILLRVLAQLMSLVVPALCVACGAHAGRAAPLCLDCRAALRPAPVVDGTWAAFTYDGPAGAVVRALKFGGRVALADLMAAQIAVQAPALLLRGTIVPVPVHPRHRRQRGVDHGHALAAALARRTALGLEPCLARTGDPRPQVGRGRRDRVRGPAGSIELRAGSVAPERALLVDDVLTTGATVSACIRALHAAGTREVAALAYARTTAR